MQILGIKGTSMHAGEDNEFNCAYFSFEMLVCHQAERAAST